MFIDKRRLPINRKAMLEATKQKGQMRGTILWQFAEILVYLGLASYLESEGGHHRFIRLEYVDQEDYGHQIDIGDFSNNEIFGGQYRYGELGERYPAMIGEDEFTEYFGEYIAQSLGSNWHTT